MANKRPLTVEQQISIRFLEVVYSHVGPDKKYRFKKAFTEAIGMSQPALAKIENGASVQFRYLISLHELFNVNLNWALTGKGERYLGKSNGQMSVEQRLSALEKTIKAKREA